jgi:hypothetical protein
MTRPAAKVCLAALIAANVVGYGWLWAREDAATPAAEHVDVELDPLKPGLRLLTELEPETIASRGPEPMKEVLSCLTWGPFHDPGIVDVLRTQLDAEGVDCKVVASEVAADPDYLVFLGPADSREAARRLLEELKSQGLESNIISRGALQNAISVGVFTREQFATAHRKRIEELGYEVGLRQVPRMQTVYHVMAESPAQSVLARLEVASSSPPGIKDGPCDSSVTVNRLL